MFFILYINDLHKAIETSKTIHFADDTSLICQEKTLKKLNKKVNRDLKLLVLWLRANKISLNTAKTQIVVFKNKRKEIKKNLNFRLSGKKMPLSSHVTYLGITLDESLEWNLQLHGLLQKVSRSVGVLAKLRYYLNYKSLLSVYYALFDSHVNFCIHTMGHVTQAPYEKLEKLQNKALRIMHYKSQRDSAKPLFINSRILPIRKQLIMKNCLFAFDFFKNNLPKYFNNFLRITGNNHNHATRTHGKDLQISMTETIRYTLRYGTYNLANLISKDWNKYHKLITVDLNSTSKSTFKKHFNSYILMKFAE